MRLFDLSEEERKSVMKFVSWHFGYVLYVTLFAFTIYSTHLFKAYWFLKESWILNLIAPLHTTIFIIVSPYRRDWLAAARNMYVTLEGDPVFCLMAMLLGGVGFYLYNAVIWGLGSLIPSIFFT